MSQITRTVSWGDALFVKAGRHTGGLNQAVERIRRAIGTQIGVRNSFAKLYDVANPAMLGERDIWRAWLLLTALEEDPSDWGVYDDAVPMFYRDRIEDLRKAVHPLGLEPRTHWVWDSPGVGSSPRGRSKSNNGPRNRGR